LIKRCEQTTTRDVEDRIIQRMQLREEKWSPELDDGQTPVLVFCCLSSRIGTDIDSAMRGVNGNYNPVPILRSVNV